MSRETMDYRVELERLTRIRTEYAAKVGHVCPLYSTARSGPPHYDGLSDPALRMGLGCPICYPPDGRYRPTTNTKQPCKALA
jgi:hypothetical protein